MTWRSDWQQPQPLPTRMPWPKPACTISMPCTGCFTRGICDQLRWESGYQVARAEHTAKLAAAERTIEKLGQDAAAIAGRLDEANENIERMRVRYSEVIAELDGVTKERDDWRQQRIDIGIKLDLFAASHKGQGCGRRELDIASPSQPEPVKAPPNDPGPHDCVFDDDGLCRIGSRTEMHREGPIVPKNAGTTCVACKGKGGFDPFGEPMEGQTNPAYQCGACQGRGTK